MLCKSVVNIILKMNMVLHTYFHPLHTHIKYIFDKMMLNGKVFGFTYLSFWIFLLKGKNYVHFIDFISSILIPNGIFVESSSYICSVTVSTTDWRSFSYFEIKVYNSSAVNGIQIMMIIFRRKKHASTLDFIHPYFYKNYYYQRHLYNDYACLKFCF